MKSSESSITVRLSTLARTLKGPLIGAALSLAVPSAALAEEPPPRTSTQVFRCDLNKIQAPEGAVQMSRFCGINPYVHNDGKCFELVIDVNFKLTPNATTHTPKRFISSPKTCVQDGFYIERWEPRTDQVTVYLSSKKSNAWK